MEPEDNQLRPQQLDDEIERLIRYAQEGGTLKNNKNAQLIQRLQHHYTNEKQKNTLQQAWKSIAQRYEGRESSSIGEEQRRDEQSKSERSEQYIMYESMIKTDPIKRVWPRWGTLVAVAVLALVIVSTAVIMSQAEIQRNGRPGTGGNGSHSICAKPTAAPGKSTETAIAQPCNPANPIATPTAVPIVTPTQAPIATPTAVPIATPTAVPIVTPTAVPIATPLPTVAPAP